MKQKHGVATAMTSQAEPGQQLDKAGSATSGTEQQKHGVATAVVAPTAV